MNPNKLVRDAGKIKACLKKLDDDDKRIVTTKDIKIYFPCRYTERELGTVSGEVIVLGIYAVVLDDTWYCLHMVNSMERLKPSSVSKVDIDGVPYYELFFEAGSTVIESAYLPKIDTLVYRIYDEFLSKGRIPWFVDYVDAQKLFDTAGKHAGVGVGRNKEVTSLIVSLIYRDSKDLTKYYRTTVKSFNDMITKPPVVTPLTSVQYGATNTTNKIAGSYFDDGVVSALNNPADRTENIERYLRR